MVINMIWKVARNDDAAAGLVERRTHLPSMGASVPPPFLVEDIRCHRHASRNSTNAEGHVMLKELRDWWQEHEPAVYRGIGMPG